MPGTKLLFICVFNIARNQRKLVKSLKLYSNFKEIKIGGCQNTCMSQFGLVLEIWLILGFVSGVV